jgi:hypothetical protein
LVNTKSGKYWQPGSRYYGNTKQGEYLSEEEAIQNGSSRRMQQPAASRAVPESGRFWKIKQTFH